MFLPREAVFQAQVGGDGTEGRNRVSWWHSKPFVVAPDEGLKDGMSLFQGGSTCQAQLKDQPLLEGLEGSFDATFGLRGMGGDVLNTQLVQDTADLG